MHRHLSAALSAATCALGVAAIGLSGCSHSAPRIPSASSPAPVPAASSPAVLAPPTAPLPPPEALTAVLNRLADPNVPGIKKVGLVEGATPDNAVTLDKFSNALRDNGYLPMALAAKDLAWSDRNPSNVRTTVSVNTARGINFTFPMEFTPNQGGWQLSKRTAEMLMGLGRSATAPAPPIPAPPPAPAPPRPN